MPFVAAAGWQHIYITGILLVFFPVSFLGKDSKGVLPKNESFTRLKGSPCLIFCSVLGDNSPFCLLVSHYNSLLGEPLL